MSLRRFEGKNVEEALDHAAAELGVERYRLSYHVLLEKRGFLGGTKRVVIEAWDDDAGNRIGAVSAESRVHTEQRPRAEARPAAQPARESGPRRRTEHEDRPRGGRKRHSDDRPEREHRTESPRIARDIELAPPVAENETESSRQLRGWFEELFVHSGLALQARVEETDDKLVARLFGEDAERLLAKHGELIDSVQIIANKTLIVRTSGKTVELDYGHFREQRIVDLEQQARILADTVREENKERALPAMSPVERRIVHLALRDDAEVETYSRGDGFYKRVVIAPKQKTGEGFESDAKKS